MAGPPGRGVAATAGRLRRAIASALGLLLIAAGCSAGEPDRGGHVVVDLVSQDWRHVEGVTPGIARLTIRATGRRISGLDGGEAQPNPPLNLAGTHLEVGGAFSVTATFRDVTADASWALYDRPPVIADEFRIEPAGVRLRLQGDDLDIVVWDGSSRNRAPLPHPVHEERVTVHDPHAPLTVRRSGGTLQVVSGADTLASLPFGDVFGSGELWLGLWSDEGSFRVDSLTAAAPPGAGLRPAGPAVARTAPSADGLQALASRIRPDFLIGAAVALGPLAADPDYARQLVANFGAITPENAMKPQALSPRQGVYTFEEADAILAIAERNGMAVHGHTITFTEALPRWMQELPSRSAAERRTSAAALLDFVRTVASHFAGRLRSVDVVNEPFELDQSTRMQRNIWYRVFGPGYPAIVSQAVSAVDPEVEQFINENGADVPGPRQEALLALVLDTNARGGDISGVGLQAHIYDSDRDAFTADQLAATLDRFERAGLRVRISENDVTDDAGTQAQADQYVTVLMGCLRSPVCVSYTTWGVDDRYNWWIDDRGRLRKGHDFLFDDARPTPAYEAMMRALGD